MKHIEIRTRRYDQFSGEPVDVPIWLPTAVVGILRKPNGDFTVYVDVSWQGGGWICSGSGATEIAAVQDLVRRLKQLDPTSERDP